MKIDYKNISRKLLLAIKLIILISVCICSLLIIKFIWGINDIVTGYDKIIVGIDEQKVINILGKPDIIENCSENIWWDSKFIKKDNGICRKQYKYKIFGEMEFWMIGFDKDNKVISKYHGGSP